MGKDFFLVTPNFPSQYHCTKSLNSCSNSKYLKSCTYDYKQPASASLSYSSLHYWTSPTTGSLLQRVQWHVFTWFCKIRANIRVVPLTLFKNMLPFDAVYHPQRTKRKYNEQKPYFLPKSSLAPSSRDIFREIIFTHLVQKLPHFYDIKKLLSRHNKGESLVH